MPFSNQTDVIELNSEVFTEDPGHQEQGRPVSMADQAFPDSLSALEAMSLRMPIHQWLARPNDPEDLITHKEMCKDELKISEATGYDWRNPKSPRYKPELAGLAIYLSNNTVRFRRGDVRNFANNLRRGVQP